MDNELDGRAVQIRLTQGHETSHFVRIFKGTMVVFSGGKASGFRSVRITTSNWFSVAVNT
jgi:hypothetical protein